MSRGRGEQKNRSVAIKRWVKGRKSDGLGIPTEKELGIFSSGFNMGYKARGRKIRESLKSRQQGE